jgi:hypothetical protein
MDFAVFSEMRKYTLQVGGEKSLKAQHQVLEMNQPC